MDQTPTTDPTPTPAGTGRRPRPHPPRPGRGPARRPSPSTDVHHERDHGDTDAVLTVENLKMYFPVKSSGIRAHDRPRPGRRRRLVPAADRGALGLVGESGCGKSTTGRLSPGSTSPPAAHIEFEGRDIAHAVDPELQPLRREIQMIFQDPYTSLNPRHTVGAIVGAPLAIHKIVPKNKILPPGAGAARDRGAQPRALQPLPARVLRRPAPAHRHRPGADPAAQAARRRRAGLGARRVDPGAGHQPAPGRCSASSTSRSSSSRTTWRSCGTSARRSR